MPRGGGKNLCSKAPPAVSNLDLGGGFDHNECLPHAYLTRAGDPRAACLTHLLDRKDSRRDDSPNVYTHRAAVGATLFRAPAGCRDTCRRLGSWSGGRRGREAIRSRAGVVGSQGPRRPQGHRSRSEEGHCQVDRLHRGHSHRPVAGQRCDRQRGRLCVDRRTRRRRAGQGRGLHSARRQDGQGQNAGYQQIDRQRDDEDYRGRALAFRRDGRVSSA